MTILSKIREAWTHLKESRAWSAILSTGWLEPRWMGRNYLQFAREGYIQNSDVYSCIKILADTCGGIKLQVYKKGGTEGTDRKAIENHELGLLIGAPNPRQSQSRLVSDLVSHLMISGNAWVERVSLEERDAERISKPPRELWTLRPDRMQVVPSADVANPILGYDYKVGSTVVPYRLQMLSGRRLFPVHHIKLFHPDDDFLGLSPMEAAARNIDAGNSGQAWNVGLLQNSAKFSALISSDEAMSQDQFAATNDRVRRNFTGPGNAGKAAVVPGKNLKVERTSMTPLEMDWLGGLDRTTVKICSVYGVPPEMIGHRAKGGLNDANYKQARKQLYLETALPLMDFICAELTAFLAPFWDDTVEIGYDRNEIEAIQEDQEIVSKRADDGIKSCRLTINDARRMTKLPPIPGGDVILVPAGLVPLDMLAKSVEAKIEAASQPPVAPGQLPGRTPRTQPKQPPTAVM